ncbi:tetratricopeptide repeat protein [Fretibacter rubidus]|uniref:tetratricopeptide repeat protein n=1 Tax=Fretibacter rubidus TaxID=570162 RepID=UPI00352B3431
MIANGDAKAAIAELEPIWETNKNNFALCQLLVDAYSDRIDQVSFLKKRGVAKTMLATMEQCYDIKPDDETAQLNLIMFHTQAPSSVGGDKEAAERLIKDISAKYPSRGFLMKARLAISEDDFAAAESFAHQAIEIEPDNVEALNVAGLIALQQNQYVNAIELFKRCVSADKQNFDCHYQIGKTAHLSGEYAQDGITAFERFIRNGHDNPEYLAHAHYRLAELYLSTDNQRKARPHLETAVTLAGLKSARKRLAKLSKSGG